MGTIRLTRQQAAALRLLLEGLTNRQIAERMRISERTVYTHLAELKRKLRAGNRSQILMQALKHCPEYLHAETLDEN